MAKYHYILIWVHVLRARESGPVIRPAGRATAKALSNHTVFTADHLQALRRMFFESVGLIHLEPPYNVNDT